MSRTLLLPSGVTQLLYQLVSVRSQGLAVSPELDVLSVCPLYGEAMKQAMELACESFGATYRGNFVAPAPPSPSSPLIGRVLDYTGASWRKYFRETAPKANAKYDVLGICVRHPNHEEALLYQQLRPKVLVCVADGVYSDSKCCRRYDRVTRRIRVPFWCLPSELEIWCPKYLLTDVARIGKTRCFDGVIEKDVYREYSQGELARRARKLLTTFARSRSPVIIFSQHLALSRLMSEESEIRLYVDLIESAKTCGADSIVFKPHPRDPKAKVTRLSGHFPEVTFIPNDLSCVPLEPILMGVMSARPVAVSMNSTALLSMRDAVGALTVSWDSALFPKKFRDELRAFRIRHQIPYADSSTGLSFLSS